MKAIVAMVSNQQNVVINTMQVLLVAYKACMITKASTKIVNILSRFINDNRFYSSDCSSIL